MTNCIPAPDLLTLANLSGAFQTTATIAFAMGVFKAPLSASLGKVEARLQRELAIVAGRADPLAVSRQADLVSVRRDLNTAAKNMAGPVTLFELIIWGASAVSSALLVWASLQPTKVVSFGAAVALVLGPIALVAFAAVGIVVVAVCHLRPVTQKLA